MIAAIYARVSKETCPTPGCGHLKTDHRAGTGKCGRAKCKCSHYTGQDPEVQLDQLRIYAKAQNWDTVEFIDFESGKHSDRVQLQAMFAAASRREFGVVVVWALDRLSREGIMATLQHLKLLKDNGVAFESFSEPQFRTTGPYGEVFAELFIALAATFAKMERLRISERTKAGLKRAAAKGTKLGRAFKIFDRDKALALRRSGKSWREIGRALSMPQSTIRHALKGVQQTSPKPSLTRKANKQLR